MSAPAKVSLSLGRGDKGKKKKGSGAAAASSLGFGDDGDEEARRSQLAASRRANDGGGPLVIPLPAWAGERSGPLLARSRAATGVKGGETGDGGGETAGKGGKDDGGDGGTPDKAATAKPLDGQGSKEEDECLDEAAKALIKSAADSRSSGATEGATNFSAKGAMVIKGSGETGRHIGGKAEGAQDTGANDEFHLDLSRRPEDLSVDSDAYAAVPISEFGAAMLRGMGWKGGDSNGKKGKGGDADGGIPKPRHHRLGLGATPMPVMLSGKGGNKGGDRHRARRPGQADLRTAQKEEEELWRAKEEEKTRKDVQRTLQVGSVVRIRDDDGRSGSKRAVVAKTAGVPGLNRILVQYEDEWDNASVKKGDAVLLSREELECEPYRHPVKRSSDDLDAKKGGKRKRQNGEDAEHRSSGRDIGSKQRRSRSGDGKDDHAGGSAWPCRDGRSRSRSGSRDHGRGGRRRDYENRRGRDDSYGRTDRRRDDRDGDYERRCDDNRDRDRRRRRSRSFSRDRDRRGGQSRRDRGHDDDESRSGQSRSRSRDREKSRRRRDRYDSSGRERRDRHRDESQRHEDGQNRKDWSRREEESGRGRWDENGREEDRDGSHRGRKRGRAEKNGDDHADEGHRRRRKDAARKEGRPGPWANNPAEEEHNRWLVSHIRVRVVSKKLDSGRQYKQKGIVVDVLGGGRSATLQMDTDGTLLENVSERHLETALPPVGGHVVVLVGQRRGAVGRLLERDSLSGRGAVQLLEDMDVAALSLDDMAEWCGPVEE